MRNTNITASALREKLAYDASTGEFVWVSGVGNVPAGSVAGSVGKRGYVDICVLKERHGAHRLAWLHVTGRWPDGEIDHKNGIKSDNRFENLRDVSRSVNTQNIRAAHRRNMSAGLLGVRRSDTKSARYNAIIMAGGAVKCLGSYASPEEAHAAYVAAKRELHEGCTL